MSEPLPPPLDPSAPEPPPAGPAVAGDGSGLPPNVAAGLSIFFPLAGGIVFLVLEKRNAFVRFYAMQSVILGGILVGVKLIAYAGSAVILSIPILGRLVAWLLGLAAALVVLAGLVLALIAAIKAFGGKEEWEIPGVGPLARKQLADNPPTP